MMDQFHELKEANPETILFFRMGDFCELFHDDAEIGSNVLGLFALTSRDKNASSVHPYGRVSVAPTGGIFASCSVQATR